MNRKKWLWVELIIYVVTALILLNLFFGMAVDRQEGQGFERWGWSRHRALGGSAEAWLVQTLHAEGANLKRIHIDLRREDILIETHDTPDILVEVYSASKNHAPLAEITENALTISQKKKIPGMNLRRGYVKLYVPKETGYHYQIEMVSGDVLGTLNGNMEIDTVSGKIDVTGSINRADVSMVSGSVKLNCAAVPYGGVAVDTVSGNVTVNIPTNDGFTLAYSAVSGRVKNEFMHSTLRQSGTEYYKDGKINIAAETISGNITIGRYE